MFDDSRIGIYDYLRSVFEGNVTDNVYDMSVPQELTRSDAKEGFIVLHVGSIKDRSEFPRNTYGWVRCDVEAFIPPISRGRVNKDKYKEFEDGINTCIREAAEYAQSDIYQIREESVLSSETLEITNANNAFYVFIKSFIVDVFQNPWEYN